jgi:tRNA(Ile)-lysidine synthase
MAERAAKSAESLGVEHVTTKIPWGEGIYPPKPTSTGKLELPARDARYALLFATMRDARVGTLALAHHADDQVETMLMRLGKGTTTLGMVGMRPRIRWGMGSEIEGLNWRGHLGLQMHKIRPLLDVGKVIFFYIKNTFQWSMSLTFFLPQRIEFLPHVKQTNWNM